MKEIKPDYCLVSVDRYTDSQSCDHAQKLHEHKILLDELAIESGIKDREILENLVRFDINADNFQALTLAPFFFLAWADGDLDQKEDEYIHEYLKSQEIFLCGMSQKLVSHWFNIPPAKEYLNAWCLYMKARLKEGSPKIREKLRSELLAHFERLAGVSGGFLGFGAKISKAEIQQLRQLRSVFSFPEV